MRKRWLALALSVLALGLVAGCGGDDDDDGGEAAQTPTTEQAPTDTGEVGGQTAEGGGGKAIRVSTPEDGSLVFDPDEIEATAGKVTIEYDNPSQVPHNLTIEGADLATDTITQTTATISGELEPGEYTFFCSVPGHRQGGMEGTLVVR